MTLVYKKFIKESIWTYAKIKIKFEDEQTHLQDSLTFRNAISLATKHTFGIMGQAVDIDVLSYEPSISIGIIRIPAE
jgi:hypothetical protein